MRKGANWGGGAPREFRGLKISRQPLRPLVLRTRDIITSATMSIEAADQGGVACNPASTFDLIGAIAPTLREGGRRGADQNKGLFRRPAFTPRFDHIGEAENPHPPKGCFLPMTSFADLL